MATGTFASVTTIELYKPGLVAAQIPIPTEWNELTLQELHIVSKHMLTPYNKEGAGRMGIFFDLVGFRARHHGVKLPKNWFSLLDSGSAVGDILALLEYLYGENTRTEQPYNRIRLRGLPSIFVYGPHSNFDNLTCGEFEDAEVFFYQFRAEPAAEPLARLASILFRPRGTPYLTYNSTAGKYQPYNSERLLPYFIKLQPWELYTIFIWYTGCRSELPKLFPTPFEGAGKNGDEEPDFAAFTKCIHSGAGPKNGSRDQIRTSLLKEFFFEMELEAQKAKELKEEYERNKRG